jgi:hypothetical protein
VASHPGRPSAAVDGSGETLSVRLRYMEANDAFAKAEEK